MRPGAWRLLGWVLGLAALALWAGCNLKPPDETAEPSELQRATAGLSGRSESAHFIFHFQPGDGARAEIERSEAYHDWAVAYLGVVPPKKIDYYMFPSFDEMAAAFGYRFGGSAFPEEFALATAYPWHNHECFHLYTLLVGDPPSLFREGMAVAHEFDPYNNVWISRWNRAKPWREPHIAIARRLRAEGLLYPMEAILENDEFDHRVMEETVRIAYEQAGAWVSYLIETYGLDRMKQIVATVPFQASREQVKARFEAVYGIGVADAEKTWLAWLEQWRER